MASRDPADGPERVCHAGVTFIGFPRRRDGVPIEYRQATPDDAAAVQRVARVAWHAAHDHIVGADAVDDLLAEWYDREGLAASIAREEFPMFLAVDDGEVAAFAQGGPTDDGPADAVVGRIYAHPDYWGEGVGTELLGRLFDALREAGCESVWLAVMADNEVGRAFYDKHGFAVHEERTQELAGQAVEDVILVRELSEDP